MIKNIFSKNTNLNREIPIVFFNIQSIILFSCNSKNDNFKPNIFCTKNNNLNEISSSRTNIGLKFLWAKVLLIILSFFPIISFCQINDFATNYHHYWYDEYLKGNNIEYYTIRFDNEIVKGDTIMGFSDDFCGVSYNRGENWEIIDLKNQTYKGKINYAYACNPSAGKSSRYNEGNIYLHNNDVIIFHRNKFFISKDWNSFKRVSSLNRSLEINEGEKDGENSLNSFKGFICNDKYMILVDNYLYKSKDCNTWEKVKTPSKTYFNSSISSSNNILYFTDGFDFYKSEDEGLNWTKIIVNFTFDFEKNESLTDFFAFNDNLHIQCWILGKGFCHIIFNLKNNTHLILNNISNRFLYKDTLFLLPNGLKNIEGKDTEKKTIYYYKDSLSLLDIDLTGIDSIKRVKNFNRFSLSDKLLVVDGQISLVRKTNSTLNSQNNDENKTNSFLNDNLSVSEKNNYLGAKSNQNSDLSKENLNGNVKKIEVSIHDFYRKEVFYNSSREYNEFGNLMSTKSDNDYSDKIEDFEMKYYPEEFDKEFLVSLPFNRRKLSLKVDEGVVYGAGSDYLKLNYNSNSKLISLDVNNKTDNGIILENKNTIIWKYNTDGNLIEKNLNKIIIKYNWQNGKLISKYAYNSDGTRYDKFYDIEYKGNNQIITEYTLKGYDEVFFTIEYKDGKIISKKRWVITSKFKSYKPVVNVFWTKKYYYENNRLVKILIEENKGSFHYDLAVKMGLNPNMILDSKIVNSEIKINRDKYGNILSFNSDSEWVYEYDKYGNWVKRTEYDVKIGDIKIATKKHEVIRKILYY